jgi:hypothetical protein
VEARDDHQVARGTREKDEPGRIRLHEHRSTIFTGDDAAKHPDAGRDDDAVPGCR